MAKFQYNMMARLDDTTALKLVDLKNNPQYPFALQCQLSWSKNVYEERSALYQILLGSADHRYCVLLGLALYLELWIESGQGRHSNYVFAGPNETPLQAKRACYNAMKAAFKAPDFLKVDELQKIGSHSIQKMSATCAKRNNCTQDEIETRGRWKQQGTRVSM